MAANLTLDQVIAQLNSGKKWSGQIITYSFPTTTAWMTQDGESLTFKPIPQQLQPTFQLAITTWDDLVPVTFQPTTFPVSSIEFGFTSSNIGYAHAYYPTGGTAWFLTGSDVASATPGSWGFTTVMHEIGHALGLNHMGDYNGQGTWTPSSYQDSRVLSIMSYFGPSGGIQSSDVMGADWTALSGASYSPQTPMVNDIAAIQAIYGVSSTTRADHTVYGFNSSITGETAALYDFVLNATPILTIFDSAGDDTLDLSGWSSPSIVNLLPGAYSSANYMTNNIAIAYSSSIENAVTGSGNDLITGNALGNRLSGGAGSDTLLGGAGDDTLTAGAANDVIYGGEGTDTVVFSGLFSAYTIAYDTVIGAYSITSTVDGIDVVYSAEFFQFANETRTVTAGADARAPTLVSHTPAADSSGVAVSANLSFTFSEAVKAGVGTISVYAGGAAMPVRTIDISDSDQVSFSAETITLNLSADLDAGQAYQIKISAGAVTDLAGNAFAGVSDASLNFVTAHSVTDDFAWNTSTTGVVVVNGDPATGAVNFVNDGDLFKVTLEAGFTYQVELKTVGGGLPNPYLQLFSPSLELVAWDDDSGANFDSLVTVTVEESGTYYLSAQDHGAGTGAYQLIATKPVDDYASNAFTTATLPVDTQLDGNIEVARDQDWFRVSLVAGTTYYFELKGFGASGGTQGSEVVYQPYLTLYDAAGTYVKATAGGTGGGDAAMSFTAGATGVYFLSAEDLYGTGIGKYTIEASTLGANADDYRGDSSTTATAMVNGEINGSIELPGDEDWFKVDLVAGATYTFELLGAGTGSGNLGAGSSQPYLSIYAPGGSYIRAASAGGTGGDPLISYTATTTGTYYLGAEELFSTGTGAYTLKVASTVDDFANGTATTGVLTVGSQATGTVNFAGDEDWFKVVLAAGTTYKFELRGFDGGGGTLGSPPTTQPYLGLYDATGLILNATLLGGVGGDPMLAFTPSASGEFFVSAQELQGTGTGTYTLLASGFADDYGSSASSAAVLALNSQATGNIDFAGDEDRFQIDLVAGTTYTFELQGFDSNGGTLGSGALHQPYLSLFNPSGGYVKATASGGTGSDPLMTFTADSTGAYYLAAEDLFSTGTGTYTLKATAIVDDYSATTATTGVLPVGGTITGNIQFAGDEDWFRVDLPGAATYKFELRGFGSGGGTLGTATGTDPYLRLLDANGAFINSSLFGGTGGDPILTIAVDSAATYYVAAKELGGAGTGTYTFALASFVDDYSSSAARAQAVTLGSATSGTINFAGDDDWFKVDLTAGQTYRMELKGFDSAGGTLGSAGLTQPYLTRYDGNGSYQAAVFNGGVGGDPAMQFTPTATGTYYFGAEELFGTGTGTYTFSASHLADDYPASTTTSGLLVVGSQITGAVELKSDVDWFKVYLQGGNTYSFELRGYDGGGGTLGAPSTGLTQPFLRLYGTTGIPTSSSSSGGAGGDPLLQYTPGASGYYYLSAQELFALGTGTYTLKATLVGADVAAPEVLQFMPADEAALVAVGSSIAVTFDEAVQSGTGVITLRTAGGTVVATYDAATSTDLGIADSTLTINPSADLGYSTSYVVEFAGGSIKDLAGNAYAGTTAYNFTTQADPTAGEAVDGGAGADSLIGTAGNDTVDGGAGTDTFTFTGTRSEYVLTNTGQGYQTQDTSPARDGTDLVTAVEMLVFSDSTVDLTMAQRAAAINASDLKTLEELYVGFFNRIPEAAGLRYWIGQVQQGVTLREVADQFYGAGVQFNVFSEAMSEAEFITVVYANVLGRSGANGPTAGDIDYWTGWLHTGTNSKGAMVLQMLSDSHTLFTGHPEVGWVVELLDNKAEVANYFAVQQGMAYTDPQTNISRGIEIAAAITPTDTSEAIALIGVNEFSMT